MVSAVPLVSVNELSLDSAVLSSLLADASVPESDSVELLCPFSCSFSFFRVAISFSSADILLFKSASPELEVVLPVEQAVKENTATTANKISFSFIVHSYLLYFNTI
ncbi:hypothetical protein D3C81_1711890 [compost metagenome]